MAETGTPPLSRRIGVETLRPRPAAFVVTPDDAERAAIVKAFGLSSLTMLEGRYDISRESERVTLEGRLVAALEQLCIVSLEPLPVKLDVPVRLVFEPQVEEDPRPAQAGDPVEIDLEYTQEDPPEPIVDGAIDIGAVTLEFLALSLDPYPRKPDAEWAQKPEESAEASPFAALARLKRDE